MKGIIFDFNGTLFWDSKLHYDAWREYSKILRGYEFTDDEMRDEMLGHTNRHIIEYAIGKKADEEMVQKYGLEKEALYRKRCLLNPDEFKLAEGVTDLLDYLKSNNIPMTIATMAGWENVEFYIKEFELTKWFDLDKIVFSDGKIPGKPAPDIFLIAAKKLGLKPEECVVVEDAIAGINAAKSAKIGKIVAVASMEPIEFYQKIDGLSGIIKDFHEFDRSMLEIPAKV